MTDTELAGRLFDVDDISDSDQWYTPPWIFEGLGVTFDLDVAAPQEPLDWIPARRRYTAADDGLVLPWHGTVWCNPPYSAPTAWCYRWARHGDGCILLRADVSTRGPFAAMSAATSLYVPARRLEFVNGHGTKCGLTNFSTVLLGAGPTADAALGRLAARSGGAARLLTNPETT